MKFQKRDLAILVLPPLIWASALHLRDVLINPYCGQTPPECRPHNVFAPDRWAIDQHDSEADHRSFMTQYASGTWAALVPLAFETSRLIAGTLTPGAALASLALDWLVLGEVAVVNGALTESLRVAIQRPRPFVYLDPEGQGRAKGNYTSFVSGHTSFSACMTMGLWLLMLARGISVRARGSVSVVGASLCLATGVFRILAGRHFPTDVLGGILVGCLAAWLVFRLRARNVTSSRSQFD